MSQKNSEGNKKVTGCYTGKKDSLYTPLIKWYLQHGLRLTTIHQLVEYEPGKPFSWFSEEVEGGRREADKDPLKKQLSNVTKLKGNSF